MSKRFPRYVGRVLEALREGEGQSQAQLHAALMCLPSSYAKPSKENVANPASTVDNWEKGKTSTPYNVLNHYADYYQINTGAIFVIGRFYQTLRDAAGNDIEHKKIHLDEAREIARKLIALSNHVIKITEEFDARDLGTRLAGPEEPEPRVVRERINLINELTREYRGTATRRPKSSTR